MKDALDWRTRAACLAADPELFFPAGTGSLSQRQASEARAFCRRCPVVDACLDTALSAAEPHGIWGGLSEHERKGRRRSVRGTASRVSCPV